MSQEGQEREHSSAAENHGPLTPAQAAVPTQENLGPAQICQPWLRLWLLEYWCGHWRPAFRSRTIRREEYPKVYILEAGPGLCFHKCHSVSLCEGRVERRETQNAWKQVRGPLEQARQERAWTWK